MLDKDWLKTFAPFGVLPKPNHWKPVGACVFVEHGQVVWCVTAAHVLRVGVDGAVGCMVDIAGKQTVVDLTAVYAKRSGLGWVINSELDLAAGPMPLPTGIAIRSIGFDRALRQAELIPSMQCLTAGHPYGLPGVDPGKPSPLVLDGVIAGLDAARYSIYISVPTFPGNSGGPIIVYKMPWDTAGGITAGVPAVWLAGIVTETVVIRGSQPEAGLTPPLHLGRGTAFDAVKNLLTGREAMQMLDAAKHQTA